jgi:hypothetical protein
MGGYGVTVFMGIGIISALILIMAALALYAAK